MTVNKNTPKNVLTRRKRINLKTENYKETDKHASTK